MMNEHRHTEELHTPDRPDPSAAMPVAPLRVRVTRITAGTGMLAAGVVMLVLPGPGLVAIAAGLGLLSKDVPAAANALQWLRRRVPGAQRVEQAPRGAVMATLSGMVAVTAIATWMFASG